MSDTVTNYSPYTCNNAITCTYYRVDLPKNKQTNKKKTE